MVFESNVVLLSSHQVTLHLWRTYIIMISEKSYRERSCSVLANSRSGLPELSQARSSLPGTQLGAVPPGANMDSAPPPQRRGRQDSTKYKHYLVILVPSLPGRHLGQMSWLFSPSGAPDLSFPTSSNFSWHDCLLHWLLSSHERPKIPEPQFSHFSFQWKFRAAFLIERNSVSF